MKTLEEKEALKRLKRDYKHNNPYNRYIQPIANTAKKEVPVQSNRILTGIMPNETILEDSHPVNWDFLYVVDDSGGKVVRSDVKGTVLTLKADLRKRGYRAENIYNCKMGDRNLF